MAGKMNMSGKYSLTLTNSSVVHRDGKSLVTCTLSDLAFNQIDSKGKNLGLFKIISVHFDRGRQNMLNMILKIGHSF